MAWDVTARVPARLPREFFNLCRRLRCLPTRDVLVVEVADQAMRLFRRVPRTGGVFPIYRPVQGYVVSTSRFGTGQQEGSNRTPLGLHRIAEKIGAGRPIGTVYRGRRPVGLTWAGSPGAAITHRILWLEGLEPGWNRGGEVDSQRRYIYLHGTGDETTLGRPSSRGCIHVAGRDILPLFDTVPVGSLVWIRG